MKYSDYLYAITDDLWEQIYSELQSFRYYKGIKDFYYSL